MTRERRTRRMKTETNCRWGEKNREAKRKSWPNRRTKRPLTALFFGQINTTTRNYRWNNSWFCDSLQSTPLTKDSVPESASNKLTHTHSNELNSYTVMIKKRNEMNEFNSYKGERHTTTTRKRHRREEKEERKREEREERKGEREGRKKREKGREGEERKVMKIEWSEFWLGQKHHSNHLWEWVQTSIWATEMGKRGKVLEENCTKV